MTAAAERPPSEVAAERPAGEAAAERPPGERVKMTVSERDPHSLALTLQAWLAARLGVPEPPQISGVRMPASGGLSSTSLLFEAEWTSGGTRQCGEYVARMAPEHSAVPVFPRYDLPGQYEIIAQVTARCGVPLPRLRWNQPDGGPLGTAFFVMDQVDGQVPLDNPPLRLRRLAARGNAAGAGAPAAGERPGAGRPACHCRAGQGLSRAPAAARHALAPAMNADTGYAIWRACFDGYETWLKTVDHGSTYRAGDAWGCVGRWYAGRWRTAPAQQYIAKVQQYLREKIWTTKDFQQP